MKKIYKLSRQTISSQNEAHILMLFKKTTSGFGMCLFLIRKKRTKKNTCDHEIRTHDG
jgi:hypothetical protein